jgi:hypothetical protein cdivTM_00575
MQVFSIKKQIILKTPSQKQVSGILNRIYKKRPDLKFKEISSYAKVYPDFVKIVKYNRPIVFTNFQDKSYFLKNEENNEENDYLQKSINRTKTKISDYILCNNFTHFITFTFDPKNSKVKTEENRHDLLKMSKLLMTWINSEQINHFRRHGQRFKYLIVPERHKNNAWHFHAVFEDYKNEIEDFYSSKNKYLTVDEIRSKNKKPKNQRGFLPRYTLGRSEIAPIKDKTKMSNYIKKYITKDLINEKYKKRYWCSKNLKTPEIIENIVESSTTISKEYLLKEYDYHKIYIIPKDSEYFRFLKYVNKLQNHFKREKLNIRI